MLIFWNTLANGVSTSDYIAFSAAFGMITGAIAQLHLLVPNLAQIKPMLESVKPILEAVPEMEEKAPQVEDLFGGIEISGVSFRYQEDGPRILRRPFPQHHITAPWATQEDAWEALRMASLDELMCTRVVIAHRLSTIRHCDRIIVLDKGKIAEEGTFEELMEKKGLFYEMSLRQL